MKNEKSKPSILLLHGWGLRAQVYKDLINILKEKGHSVYSLDLPGFGSEPLVHNNMALDDYIVFVRRFIEKRKLIKPIIIGHSFGGRVAIKYTWKYPDEVSKLILTGVPIIRHTSVIKKLAFVTAVLGGMIFKGFPKGTKQILRKALYRFIGEWDYYNAGKLQQVFKNIIEEDLIQYAREVHVPTLLIWGANDRLTPASDIKKIKKYLPHAQSFIIGNVGHKLPYTDPQLFFKAIQSII